MATVEPVKVSANGERPAVEFAKAITQKDRVQAKKYTDDFVQIPEIRENSRNLRYQLVPSPEAGVNFLLVHLDDEGKRVIVIGCLSTANTTIETNKGKVHAKLETFPFDESVNKADLIFNVEIGNAIREKSEPSPKSLFQGTIINTFKNDNSIDTQTINILQQDNSDFSFNENQPFTKGEQSVLMLRRASGIEEPNTYWILGE